MPCSVDFESIPWEEPQAGIRSKATRFGTKQLRLVEHTDQMEPHWCEKSHAGCILEGRMEITFEKTVVEFGAGDGVVIPRRPRRRHVARVDAGPVLAMFVEDA